MFILSLAGWRLHAGLEDSVLIHDLLHQLLLLPTELAQLLPEGKCMNYQIRKEGIYDSFHADIISLYYWYYADFVYAMWLFYSTVTLL